MNNSTSNIGNNIKILREAYGESQMDLAHAIGFDSPATISMMESGSRARNRYEAITRIAHHFHTTESALFHQDYGKKKGEKPNYLSLPIEDPEKTRALFAAALPIIYGSDGQRSLRFGEAYYKHLAAASQLKETLSFSETAFNQCMNLYASCVEDRISDAIANSLWWLLVYGLFHCYPKFFTGLQKLEKGSISKQDFFKYWCLSDCSPESAEQQEALFLEFRKRYARDISDLIHNLYTDSSYFFAEYYTALFYLFGLSGDGLPEESSVIGKSMIRSLASMGNPFALSCLHGIEEFHKV